MSIFASAAPLVGVPNSSPVYQKPGVGKTVVVVDQSDPSWQSKLQTTVAALAAKGVSPADVEITTLSPSTIKLANGRYVLPAAAGSGQAQGAPDWSGPMQNNDNSAMSSGWSPFGNASGGGDIISRGGYQGRTSGGRPNLHRPDGGSAFLLRLPDGPAAGDPEEVLAEQPNCGMETTFVSDRGRRFPSAFVLDGPNTRWRLADFYDCGTTAQMRAAMERLHSDLPAQDTEIPMVYNAGPNNFTAPYAGVSFAALGFVLRWSLNLLNLTMFDFNVETTGAISLSALPLTGLVNGAYADRQVWTPGNSFGSPLKLQTTCGGSCPSGRLGFFFAARGPGIYIPQMQVVSATVGMLITVSGIPAALAAQMNWTCELMTPFSTLMGEISSRFGTYTGSDLSPCDQASQVTLR